MVYYASTSFGHRVYPIHCVYINVTNINEQTPWTSPPKLKLQKLRKSNVTFTSTTPYSTEYGDSTRFKKAEDEWEKHS